VLGKLADETLDRPVFGVNLTPGSLRDQLGEAPTLLIFLRFFGCVFCRETVSDLRKLSEERDDFPRVLFISEAAKIEVQAFLRRYWPTASAIADPAGDVYADFGIGKSVLKTFSPRVFVATARALAKGNERGPTDGNVFRMPGAFLIDADEIVWKHDFRHAGEQPDFAQLPYVVR
jgi:hypothetical protein